MPNSDISSSPADGSHVFDDFFANSGVADVTTGTLNWELTTIGAAASTPSFVASQNGVVRFTTGNTGDADGEAFTLHPDGVTLGGTQQEFWFRARFPSVSGNVLAGNNFRIGLSASVTVTEPAVGVWVDSNSGVIELDGASTNGDKNAAAAGVSTLTSGTTMVLGTWHNFHVIMDGTNTNGGPKRVRLYVDNDLAATFENFLLGSTETLEFSIVPPGDI